MLRKTSAVLLLVVLSLVVAVPALADAPNFDPAIYADGMAWGTKGTTPLPAPNEHNAQSFDMIFVVTNGVDGQLPISEAGPGNHNYNGGRWSAYSATWLVEPRLLTSYAQLEIEVLAGNLVVESLHNYFQCPLLPVK
jgi:hypothetical protein